MTREDIIRMARQDSATGCGDELTGDAIERFAALVAAAAKAEEREACAKVCEAMRPTEREFDQRFYTACTLNANAIRARSNT